LMFNMQLCADMFTKVFFNYYYYYWFLFFSALISVCAASSYPADSIPPSWKLTVWLLRWRMSRVILLWDRTCVYTLHLLYEWRKKKDFVFIHLWQDWMCLFYPPSLPLPFAIFNLSGWGHKCLNQKEGMSEQDKKWKEW